MKILYATQATGNGHISRACELLPILERYCDLEVFISGYQGDLTLPFPPKFNKRGLSYMYGKNGNIDYINSLKKLKPIRFIKDIFSTPLSHYDLIINDFEPITAWASKMRNINCLALSHQASFFSNKTPRPNNTNLLSESVIKYFAPAKNYIGFHFKSYDQFIETPIIRKDIKNLNPKNKNHITVYLPSYSDQNLVNFFSVFSDFEFQIFSKLCKQELTQKNCKVYPVDKYQWIESFSSSYGVIMGAGFEGPSEALYLNKRLLVIPMKGQYEQLCNAQALKELGIPVLFDLDIKAIPKIENWMNSMALHIKFPDIGENVIERIIEMMNSYKVLNYQI